MSELSRRKFLKQTGWATLGAAGLVLRADAAPTPTSHDAAEAEKILIEMGPPPKATVAMRGDLKQTVARELGPFYKTGAPFRAKVCPPFEAGNVLVVSGRVWAFDTKKPLPGAVLDLWQVDNEGRYSSGNGDFKNRARLLTTEDGYYEFETIHPVPYQPNSNMWRSPHIHFIAQCQGYQRLVSEMFFAGDPKQDVDWLFHPALVVPYERKEINGKAVEFAVFDIVLTSEKIN
jgi:catechol 1,2-dioxygenase